MDPDERDLIDWMAARGPDDWHRVANTWNFDCALNPLLWIVGRRDCDRGTAVMLFHRAEPYCWFDFDDSNPPPKDAAEVDAFPLLMTILRNRRAGFYQSMRFKLREDDASSVRMVLNDRRMMVGARWSIPEDLCVTIPDGVEIKATGFVEGWPPEFVARFRARYR